MGDVEKAVLAAQAALPKYLGGRKPAGIRVEEVHPPSPGNSVWQITLSYLEDGVEQPEHPVFAVRSVFRNPPPPERVMRVITIDATNFEPRSMTLRQAG